MTIKCAKSVRCGKMLFVYALEPWPRLSGSSEIGFALSGAPSLQVLSLLSFASAAKTFAEWVSETTTVWNDRGRGAGAGKTPARPPLRISRDGENKARSTPSGAVPRYMTRTAAFRGGVEFEPESTPRVYEE